MNTEVIELVARYGAALRRSGVPVRRIFVFGSTARGTRHEWSDIDVGVVGDAFAKDRTEEMVQLQMIASKIDPAISPIPLRPEDLEDRFDTIGDAIRKEGKEVLLE